MLAGDWMRAFVVSSAAIARCPTHRMDVAHYRLDGTCECVPAEAPFLGWPIKTTCECGARAELLVSTWLDADYECRGTPTDPDSVYGPDRCGKVFTRRRTPAQAAEANP